MTHEDYLQLAIDEAAKGMNDNCGGPFGAVIVQDGAVIATGCNRVTSTSDPTAHAEIVAIREACAKTGQFHLPDAVIYASCEPCPMCLAAIYWAGIRTVYYSSDKHDAERIGFSDRFIYDELEKPQDKRQMAMTRIRLEQGDKLFGAWLDKQDKTPY